MQSTGGSTQRGAYWAGAAKGRNYGLRGTESHTVLAKI